MPPRRTAFAEGVRVLDHDASPADDWSGPHGCAGVDHRPVDAVTRHELLRLGGERVGLGLERGRLGFGQQGADPVQQSVRQRGRARLAVAHSASLPFAHAHH
jgi:hypothetical protein